MRMQTWLLPRGVSHFHVSTVGKPIIMMHILDSEPL